ncbi:hypothetical protein BVX97_06455 [bacterium E08(2017)]|nr:hypothetical protein BVX97_06455 [bacterium E08(2017)]
MLFKECSSCPKKWISRDEFLEDPCVDLIGYQANYVELERGLFLFQHNTNDCGTSLAISASEFTDMHDGPMFADIKRQDVKSCPGYCGQRHLLDPCGEECECGYVRDVLDTVNKWEKKDAHPEG